ncbi:MAG TPA: diaminopimelate decarboxylase [Gemmatimonadaceae bacterium]
MGEGVLTPPSLRGDAGGHAGIARRGGTLFVDELPLEGIVAAVGTPVYVYSARAIRSQYRRLAGALAGVPHRLHYSVKANSNLAILALLRELGAGVDIVSGGELRRALLAGFAGRDIVFSGVGKTEEELRLAAETGVRFVNVESEGELRLLDEVARRLGVHVPVTLRVNPEVDVDTPHPYTNTGSKGMKFGIPSDQAEDVGRLALTLPGVRLVGLDMHIGSQISDVAPYEHGVARLLALVESLRRAGATDIVTLDVGGGLAVTYDDEPPADVDAFGRLVSRLLGPTGLEIVLEPGRFLVGNAGVLVARALYRKHSGGKDFLVTDAGMNDLLRPSHYEAYHRIEALAPSGRRATVDVVGPICESGDFLALDREMDDVAPGDLVVVHTAGAYGHVMSSNYNSRPRPPEVLVDGAAFAVVRERETFDDLVRHERISLDWRTA